MSAENTIFGEEIERLSKVSEIPDWVNDIKPLDTTFDRFTLLKILDNHEIRLTFVKKAVEAGLPIEHVGQLLTQITKVLLEPKVDAKTFLTEPGAFLKIRDIRYTKFESLKLLDGFRLG